MKETFACYVLHIFCQVGEEISPRRDISMVALGYDLQTCLPVQDLLEDLEILLLEMLNISILSRRRY